MIDLDFYASSPHYIDHLEPVWTALEPAGIFGVPTVELARHAQAKGIPAAETELRKSASGRPVLVASGDDARKAGSRPIALMEHGVGQTYIDSTNVSYAGGDEREYVQLFLCPNKRVERINKARYPDATYAVVGTPYLDYFIENRDLFLETRKRKDPLVVISFHWPARVSIESGTAWPDWVHQLGALKDSVERRGWILRGHGHPRVLDRFRRAYQEVGIEVIEKWEQVMALASIYIVDNSSTLYEFAGAGNGPTIALRSSDWRTDVHHGLRFWDAVPGPDLSPGDKIEKWLDVVMADNPSLKEKRANALEVAYSGTLDGDSTWRTVAALEGWMSE